MKMFISLFLFFALVACAGAESSKITLESLGRLSLTFEKPRIVPSVPTPEVTAEVTYLPGNGYQLVLPFRVFQQSYLVAPQSLVQEASPLVKLSGSEVHHFYESLKAQKDIYQQAEQRYKQNLPLFKSKSINQQSWQTITDNYFASKLALGHLEHANEMLQSTGDDDTAFLISPVAGVFLPAGEQLDSEAFVYGEIIEQSALRLKVQLPSSIADAVTAFSAGQCHVPVEYREKVNKGLVTRLWSAPLSGLTDCDLRFAQSVTVTPMIETAGLGIPASSVFFNEGHYYALMKQGEELMPVPVSVLGRHSGQLLIADNAELRNAQLLVTSVSAVQGILLGLGGE